MFRSILVQATGSAADTAAYRAALAIARPFAARITFLHARLDVRAAVTAMASAGIGGGVWIGEAMQDMEHDADRYEREGLAAFEAFCRDHRIPLAGAAQPASVTAEWVVRVGAAPAVVASQARYADLLVAAREPDRTTDAFAVLQETLLNSGRPLLLVPGDAAAVATEVVAVAWKSTPEAARAITASLPLIARAGRVLVISVDEGAGLDQADSDRLGHYLRCHHAQMEVRSVASRDAEPAQALLDTAQAAGTTLLVMGGYSRSRLHEIVFGGFTRRILQTAPLPVLMAH